MSTESGFDQTPSTRDLVRSRLSTFNMLWDDTRPSQDIGQVLGLPAEVMVISSTPQSMQKAGESMAKRQVMTTLIDAFSLVPITQPGRRYFLEIVSATYDMGLPASHGLLALQTNLANDDLGILEETKLADRERSTCGSLLATYCFNILGAFLISIPDREAEKMSNLQVSEVLKDVFTRQDGTVATYVEIMEYVRQNSSWMQGILSQRFEELGKAVEWARAIKTAYKDNSLDPIVENVLTFIPPSKQQ